MSAGDLHIGNYRLLRKIGQGALGVVWEAEFIDDQLIQQEARVAIIIQHGHWPDSSDNQDLRKHLLHDTTLAKLIHPPDLHVLDSGADNGRQYLVTELTAGQLLTQDINYAPLAKTPQTDSVIENVVKDRPGQELYQQGLSYDLGLDVPKNFAKAVELYRQAAKKNCQEAQERLFKMTKEINIPADLDDLGQAVQFVARHGNIYLAPGRHIVTEVIYINKPFNLIGTGSSPDATVIENTTALPALFKITLGNCKIQNVTLNLALVEDKDLDYSGCLTLSGATKSKIQNCSITGQGTGLRISNKANPAVTNCKIYNNKKTGLLVCDGGQGKFKECSFFGNSENTAAIWIVTSGNPVLNNCDIYDNENSGVWVGSGGLGTFKGCRIYRHAEKYAAVVVTTNGNPTLANCKIYDNKSFAIWVYNGGKGVFQKNRLRDNNLNWVIDATSSTVIRMGNKPNL